MKDTKAADAILAPVCLVFERFCFSRFAHHPDMNWPDTLAWGPDGEMYVVSNHLHVWVDGDMNFDDPEIPNFRIWKIPGVGQSYTN